jgi:hypothetical protein
MESRNRQVIEGKLAYTEFLAKLVGDEVARRENKKLSLRAAKLQTRAQAQRDGQRGPEAGRHEAGAGTYEVAAGEGNCKTLQKRATPARAYQEPLPA